MSNKKNVAKPDDRSDNVEKLKSMVQDTLNNIDESEETLQHTSGESREEIINKNKKRERALEGYRDEIKDEVKDSKSKH